MSEQPVIELADVHGGYGSAEVLHGVSLVGEAGQIIALVGGNGAGKTTTINVIAGKATVSSGVVRFAGVDLRRRPPHALARLGIAQVPEGRRLFPSLSVADNLALGAFSLKASRRDLAELREEVFDRFPILSVRRKLPASTLSGGEAQLLAIGRALMSRPRLILLDEPSLGLAPRMIDLVFEGLRQLAARGTTILLAEQNAVQALAIADTAFVLERGSTVLAGDAREIGEHPDIVKSYLGGVTA